MSTTRIATLLAILLVVAGTAPLTAFPASGPGGPQARMAEANRHSAGPGPGLALDVLVRFLDLTEEQVETARGLVEEHRDAVAPIHDDLRAVHEELRALLESDAPDPTAIGNLILEIEDLKTLIRDELANLDAAFTGMLTSEQAEDYEDFKELRRLFGHGPGGPGPKAGPGPDAGPRGPRP